jgi:hypothetical protein
MKIVCPFGVDIAGGFTVWFDILRRLVLSCLALYWTLVISVVSSMSTL